MARAVVRFCLREYLQPLGLQFFVYRTRHHKVKRKCVFHQEILCLSANRPIAEIARKSMLSPLKIEAI